MKPFSICLLVTVSLSLSCKKSSEHKVADAPAAAVDAAAVDVTPPMSMRLFPVGRYKLLEASSKHAFVLEIVEQNGPYWVLEWKSEDTAPAIEAGKATAKELTVLSMSKEQLKLFYKCVGDATGNPEIKGFATITKLANDDLRYELVSPPNKGGTAWDCKDDVAQFFGTYRKIAEAPNH